MTEDFESNVKRFLSKWNELNDLYQEICPEGNHHIGFPDPLQKNLLSLYDPSLIKPVGKSSYDFNGIVEVKSSTLAGGGNTPFQVSQANCNRVIYLEIGKKIEIYDINDVTVIQEINNKIKNGENVILKQYKDKGKTKTIG